MKKYQHLIDEMFERSYIFLECFSECLVTIMKLPDELDLPVVDLVPFVGLLHQIEVVEKDPSNRTKMKSNNSIFSVLEKTNIIFLQHLKKVKEFLNFT